MTSKGRQQTEAVLVTPFTAPGLPRRGLFGFEADHRVVDLCAAISRAEPFAT
jgi:hypothetical protein